LNKETEKKNKHESKIVNTIQMRLDYSRADGSQYCNVRELALAYESDSFLHYLKKSFGQ